MKKYKLSELLESELNILENANYNSNFIKNYFSNIYIKNLHNSKILTENEIEILKQNKILENEIFETELLNFLNS